VRQEGGAIALPNHQTQPTHTGPSCCLTFAALAHHDKLPEGQVCWARHQPLGFEWSSINFPWASCTASNFSRIVLLGRSLSMDLAGPQYVVQPDNKRAEAERISVLGSEQRQASGGYLRTWVVAAPSHTPYKTNKLQVAVLYLKASFCCNRCFSDCRLLIASLLTAPLPVAAPPLAWDSVLEPASWVPDARSTASPPRCAVPSAWRGDGVEGITAYMSKAPPATGAVINAAKESLRYRVNATLHKSGRRATISVGP